MILLILLKFLRSATAILTKMAECECLKFKFSKYEDSIALALGSISRDEVEKFQQGEL